MVPHDSEKSMIITFSEWSDAYCVSHVKKHYSKFEFKE